MAKSLEDKRRIAREASRRWRAKNPERAKQVERDAYHRRRIQEGKPARVILTEAERIEARKRITEKWCSENRDRIRATNRATYYRHRERRLAQIRLRTYGLTQEQLTALGKTCGICDATSSGRFSKKTGREYPMHIDHCHETNKVRGMLCVRCNVGLGYFKHDVALLTKAMAYLERTA